MAFKSTVKPVTPRAITPATKMLVDAVDGYPVGIQNPNANGEDFLPLPQQVTQAELDSPSATMLADVTATYVLNESPYSRWRSDGVQMIGMDTQDFTYIEYNTVIYEQLTVTEPDVFIVKSNAELRIIESWPS